MRPFRVYNRVSRVPVMWKVAGVRLGGIGQVAMLLAASVGVALILLSHQWLAVAVFGSGFLFIVTVSGTLRRLDPDEVLGDFTAFRLLANGMRHRYSTNYDSGR